MTDTDWLALADFLDAHANDMRSWTEDEPKFRATAEGLRQLAAITAAAIGDPAHIADAQRAIADHLLAEGFGAWVDHDDAATEAMAALDAAGYDVVRRAASLSPTPTPQHCPTCGSTAKAARMFQCFAGVPDAWHDEE